MVAFFLTTFSSRSDRRLQVFLGALKRMLMQGTTPYLFLSQSSLMSVLDSLQGIPRWPDLYHFRSLNSTGEFADGTKFEDLSKVN
jgi:hypothetical protein